MGIIYIDGRDLPAVQAAITAECPGEVAVGSLYSDDTLELVSHTQRGTAFLTRLYESMTAASPR